MLVPVPQVAKSDEFVRKVEADLGSMRQRTGQLAALLRSRERQLDAARKGVDAAQAAEAQLAAQLQQVWVYVERPHTSFCHCLEPRPCALSTALLPVRFLQTGDLQHVTGTPPANRLIS